MASVYHHSAVEKKWQREWARRGLFAVEDTNTSPSGKAYVLDMFPYPSAQGLHVGHPEGYTASDIVSRYLRMTGKHVLHPMGFDAFGLPAENYAIKTGTHPAATTAKNIKNMRKQIQSLGFSYDWSREVITSDPAYYKWTQWIFVQLFKHGLAYEAFAPINWCPKDKTGLANEEVVNGKCERCGTVVTKKQIKQWLVKITDERYIERLLHGLDKLDWPANIKLLQRNWIGRSEGALVNFELWTKNREQRTENSEWVSGSKSKVHSLKSDVIGVFTTRPDTLFGATYMVLSPEHPLVDKITTPEQRSVVGKYQIAATRKSDLDRTDLAKEKTGVFTGAYAINPVNDKKIPIWIADYVLSSYGTGAIMAVPAHDERDFAFAKKFKLPITQVIAPLFENTTDLKVRTDLPMETRRLIYGIVRNPKDNTYLCLDWPDQSWGSFVVGGIEGKENTVDAAKREILEETGYKHVKFISEVPWEVHTKFFAPHKKENRYGVAVGVVFDLIDDQQGPVSSEEKRKHRVKWIPKDKVRDFVTHRNAKFIWDNYLQPSAYVGEGVMVNSGQYDGLDSVKFKDVIIKQLNSKAGRANNTCLVVHGIGGHERENWFPWLKKELANNSWDVMVPNMPDTDHPALNVWDAYLGQYDQHINEHSVLVGHSLGCAAVLYHLQTSGRNVDTVILVAPTNPLQQWSKLKHDFPHADWDAVKTMNNPEIFNWKKIRSLAKRFIIIHSDNDPFIPTESMAYYRKNLPEAEIHLFSGKLHFSRSNGGMTTFPEIIQYFPKQSGGAKATVNYKLRDWLFSRQRYWGEPIPIVHCEKCGNVPVPEEDLPLELPKVKKYEPTGTGESPLASIDKWVNTKCPQCGGKAKRETNTMPQWAGSNWYFLRYCDPNNEKQLADPEKLKAWLPVDLYVGGAEHAVLHLLYARFIYKFLFDIGAVPPECGEEPFVKLKNQGLILGEDNQKMSKSRGNVVNPDDVIKQYGADAMRLYEMFMGPFEDAKPWSTKGIIGMSRFLERIWQWGNNIITLIAKNDQRVLVENEGRKRILHKTIKKVTEDIEHFRFNTAISQLMIFFKEVTVQGKIFTAEFLMTKDEFEIFLKLLSPFAPHFTAELCERLGHKELIDFESWPIADKKMLVESELSIPIQINGKVRDQITVPAEASEDEVMKLALSNDKVKKWLDGKKPKMSKYVKGRIITIAV